MKTPSQLGMPKFSRFASAYFTDLPSDLKAFFLSIGFLLSPLWFPFFYAGWYAYLLFTNRKAKRT